MQERWLKEGDREDQTINNLESKLYPILSQNKLKQNIGKTKNKRKKKFLQFKKLFNTKSECQTKRKLGALPNEVDTISSNLFNNEFKNQVGGRRLKLLLKNFAGALSRLPLIRPTHRI
jgi:hypothetical protein